MKNINIKTHLIVATFILLFSYTAFTQETVTIDRQTAESAFKAFQLVPELEAKLKEKDEQIKVLEAREVNPCSIGIARAESLINSLGFGEPTDTPSMVKARKQARKFSQKIIVNSLKAQCNWKESEPFWKQALQFATLLGLAFK